MGGDDYVICRNTRQIDPYKAAHELDDLVDRLKEQIEALRIKLSESDARLEEGD